MLWIVGLILGAFVGSLGGFQGIVLGAIAGALLVYAAGKRGAGAERIAALEETIERLRLRLDDLEQRLDRSGQPAGTTSSAEAAFAQPPPEAPVVDAQRAADATVTVQPQPAASAHAPAHASEAAVHAQVADAMPQPAASASIGASEAAGVEPPARGTRFAFWSWLTGGNPFLRVGVVVLFFGVAFLLRYAAEHIRFSIELRLAAVTLGAIVLLAIGWRLRMRRAAYALVLQGTAIGVLFLTVFAAYRLYGLIPAVAAFVLLAALAAFCALLAIAQDSRALAVAAVSGGFLAPVLASTGAGSHVALFSYYLVLDAGILAIAWFKAWRILNVVGFAFTFLVGALWGARFYRPELFGTTEPFLIAFFLLYVAIALLFARRQALALGSPVDGTIVFGTPLVAFVLQAQLVERFEYGAAFSALAASAFYLALWTVLARRNGQGLRLLGESFLALGVVFATAAIPLAFEARVSSACWALEGAGIVWISVRQRRTAGQIFGVLLQFGAGVAFVLGDWPGPATWPVLNSAGTGLLMIALAGMYCAWALARCAADDTDWRYGIAWLLFVWGLAFWCALGWLDIERFVAIPFQRHATLLFLAASCAVFSVLYTRLGWLHARFTAWAWLPLMVLFALVDASESAHPFAHAGAIAWPLAALLHFALLYRHEDQGMPARAYHAAGLIVLTVLAGWEVRWALGEAVPTRSVWRAIGWVIVPAAVLGLLAWRGERLRWPVARHLDAYLRIGCTPIAVFVFLWIVTVNLVTAGNPAPLPYVPVLNPLDLAQIGCFAALFAWATALRRHGLVNAQWRERWRLVPLAGAAVFVWLNAVLLRTLHQWAGVPFAPAAMMDSMLVQASLSLFWTVLALCAMVYASRRAWRGLWIAGAALLAVVTGKLFFVDLSNVGGVERIVSFLGVGLLLLLVGYFSPAPPKQAQ